MAFIHCKFTHSTGITRSTWVPVAFATVGNVLAFLESPNHWSHEWTLTEIASAPTDQFLQIETPAPAKKK